MNKFIVHRPIQHDNPSAQAGGAEGTPARHIPLRRLALCLVPLLLANLFCMAGARPAPAATPSPDLSAIVNATMTAVSASQPKPTLPPATQASTAAPAATQASQPLGVVVGENLMFPADKMPALRIVFYSTEYLPVATTDTAPGQNSYSIELPAGSYHVVAYSLGGDGFNAGTAGGYTQAVPCGLSVNCNDHHLLLIVVKPGEKLTGINPNDYYAPDKSFPPMPK